MSEESSWFGSYYYDLLYSHRNSDEAARFITNLINEIRIPEHAEVLDAPCGTGRHSAFLALKGFQVTGVDISDEAIKKARRNAPPGAQFYVHDIRNVFRTNYFDLALNLFTSLGYGSRRDDVRIIRALCLSLKQDGILVLDYLNPSHVIPKLVAMEKKTCEGIEFDIRRRVENDLIIKEIGIKDGNKNCSYREQVRVYSAKELTNLVESEGLRVTHTWGNYDLNPYNEQTSERILLLASRKQ